MLNAQLFALTAPLITTSSGAKMGKTAAGAVWLNAHQVSPYDYWQYWRNTEDGDVVRFLKLFTVLPMNEIARLASFKGNEINDAKKILATEAAPPPIRRQRQRGRPSRKAPHPYPCRQYRFRKRICRPVSACSTPSCWLALQHRMARSGAPLVTARSPSMTPVSQATST